MLVNKDSDFLALRFLTDVDDISTLGLLSVTPSGINTIASYRISLSFCWFSHLPTCWYVFFMLFKHLCSKEENLNKDWSIPIVFIWSSICNYCSIHLITTHSFSNVSINRIQSMDLLSIRDLTHCAAWWYFLLIWKHKYSLPYGGIFVVVVTQQVE